MEGRSYWPVGRYVSGIHAKYHPQFGSRPSPDEPSLRTFVNGVLDGVRFSAPGTGAGVR